MAAPPRLEAADADAAVEQLYAAHWRQLVRLSVLLVHDQGAAEDVVQDAFVAMHGKWSRLRDPDKALAYLRQAVVNRSRSTLRHRVVVDRHARTTTLADVTVEGPSVGGARRDAVRDALLELPDRQREVLVLRHYLDWSEAQIADALGISPGAVKSHAHRGRRSPARAARGLVGGRLMNDRITDLLHEVADDVEPGDRLDAIRAATGVEIGVRRPGRGWWAAGGVGLVAASVVAALALTTGGAPTREQQPAGSLPSTDADLGRGRASGRRLLPGRHRPSDCASTASSVASGPVIPSRPRSPLVFAGTPSDPDYRTGWPPVPGTFVGAEVVDDVIRVEIGDPELLIEHDPPVVQNALAIEQVIFTAQAALQERLPVQFVHDGEPVGELLGARRVRAAVRGTAGRGAGPGLPLRPVGGPRGRQRRVAHGARDDLRR